MTIEVGSFDEVASVEVLVLFGGGLDVQFSFLLVAVRCLHKTFLASCKRRSHV